MKPDLAQPGASRATYRSLRQRIQGRELGVREVVTPFLCVAVPLSILFLPLQISTAAAKALAISLGMVLFWIFMPIEHAIVGMIGCFLYWAAGCVNFETAFNGFAQDTPWFLYGAIILGTVAARTGLARRLAYLVMSVVGVSYGQILAGIIFVNFLLTFIVPSGTARVVILASICLGIVEAFGVAPKSNVARGLFIVFTYTATIFDKMLIAGASSLVARGLIERDGGVPVYYSQWFFAYLPCDLLTIAACWAVVMWLYPPEKKQLANGREYIDAQLAKLGPFSSEEKRASVLMLAALALWLTDFLHHIPASMIGIGAGLAACLPLVGLMGREDVKRVDTSAVFLTAAVLSMAVVLEQTKAIQLINAVFFSGIQGYLHSVSHSTVVLYWTGFFYHFFLPEPSNISTSMPLLMSFAKSHNLNPLAIGMIWTFAAGGKIFMYQSPVLVVGYSYGQFEAKDLFNVGLILTVIDFFILMLLVPTLWPMIGIR